MQITQAVFGSSVKIKVDLTEEEAAQYGIKCGGPGSGVPGPCPIGDNHHALTQSALADSKKTGHRKAIITATNAVFSSKASNHKAAALFHRDAAEIHTQQANKTSGSDRENHLNAAQAHIAAANAHESINKPSNQNVKKPPNGSIRDQVSNEKFHELALSQAKDANDIILINVKYPNPQHTYMPTTAQDYELRTVPLAKVRPSQSGEDYINTSSQDLALHIGKFGSSDRSKFDHDDSDYRPIAVNSNYKILDGNHRHAARVLAGLPMIDVLVAAGPGTGKVKIVK